MQHKPCALGHKNCALIYRVKDMCPHISGTKLVPLHSRHKPCVLGNKSCALTYWAQNVYQAQKLCTYISGTNLVPLGTKVVPLHIRHKTCALTLPYPVPDLGIFAFCVHSTSKSSPFCSASLWNTEYFIHPIIGN